MKRFRILILSILSLSVSGLYAQSSMTDNQVMEYILQENERGLSQKEIVSRLIQRGVTTEQLQRVRRKYNREKSGEAMGAKNISGTPEGNRLRENNGEVRENVNPYYDKRNSQAYNGDMRGLTQNQRRRLNQRREADYMNELDGLDLPDTLVYDDLKFSSNTREVFGRNIFRNKELTFESDMNIATPQDYRLGAGDVVYVDVWGTAQQSFTCTVSPEGEINISGYGLIKVGGMSVSQANSHLKNTLGKRYSGSQVKLSVGQTKTITVNVMGEVENPGTYTLSAFATVFQALYMAGGTNSIGTLRDIKVYRNGNLISSVDIYDYILNGNLTGNVRLASGDVITVGPYDCLVTVAGKVKRPMIYEMKSHESVETLLGYAGGFAGDAFTDNVRLVRKKGGQMSVYNLDEFERGTFQLADADSIFVDSTLARFKNMVEIKGAVMRPGMYQMDGTVTTVRELVERAGGFSEEAFTARGVMHRRRENRTLEVLAVDLEGIMNHEVADVPLRNEDVLFVPSIADKNEELELTISGEVKFPGTYQYADNTTVEDLILQAGGLNDAASLVKVDVSRRIRDNKATKTENVVAQNFTFTLKDGFVVSGEMGFVLQPFDEVYVRRSPGYNEQQHVSITGEIAFPGSYVLAKKNMRLSELIKQAGGLTAEAYAGGARLERKMTADEQMRQKEILQSISAGDSISSKLLKVTDVRYVGINLDKAVNNPGDDKWDLVLEDGDRLVIPQYNNTVSVMGEVMYPNTVAYVKGKGLSYYLNQAGGYSTKARKRAFAVHMNGTVSRIRRSSDILPGSQILVPTKTKKQSMGISVILSLCTSMVSMAAIVVNAIRK